MPLTPNADAAAAAAGSNSIAGIAQILNALAPIFLGSSGQQTQNTSGQTQQTSNQGTTGSTQQTQQSSTTSDPGIIAALLQSFNQAQGLANDPTATQSLIDNIIHQSLLAFAPQLANANAAGLYNSSTLGLLAGNAAAEASRQGAATALNFKQNEQQIAANIGSSLLGAIKNTTTTGNTDTNQQVATNTTGQQAQQTQTNTKQNPSISGLGNSSSLIPILGIVSSLLGPSLVKGITGQSPSDLVGSGFDYVKRLLGFGSAADNLDIGFGPGNIFPESGPPPLSSDFGLTSPVTNQFATDVARGSL